ncbi:MAG: hypothetical protein H7228_14600 [Polaromonas sp.]|nr:hypothetical protein [Polaromonas sp.]
MRQLGNNLTFTQLRTLLALCTIARQSACASPITAKVTSFNQWPADAAGSTFGYIRPADQAMYEGDNDDLPDLAPYLVRAVFDGFPEPNGRVRVLCFDSKTGEVSKR